MENRWDSKKYLEFEKERTQPAIDLARRIEDRNISSALDVGCGPGNSSVVIKNIFPNADILGIDFSSDMIERARKDYPNISFEQWDADVFIENTSQKFDLIFSNACLQWLPNPLNTIKNLYKLLNDCGILAVQIPCNFDEPIHRLISKVVTGEKWKAVIKHQRNHTNSSVDEYYNVISDLSDYFDIWTITYHHIIPSYEALWSWYEGTGLRPYLSQIDDSMKDEFKKDIMEEIKNNYPLHKNGKIILNFPRLFFTVEK
ncbi:MAG: methyltransferase domain-containing protein [Clostridia bacterium]|nr:methyltransferase domain-containing protein [Clostridia bacterium]